MKRISALLAVLCMMVLWVFPAGAVSFENANSWRYSGGQPLPSPINEWGSDLDEEEEEPKPFHPGATLVGIDVSHHQGKIDWAAVAADGIKFAILRCGYGENLPEQDDRYFEYNAAECQRLGIPYGVYLYSYATDAARAELEADHVPPGQSWRRTMCCGSSRARAYPTPSISTWRITLSSAVTTQPSPPPSAIRLLLPVIPWACMPTGTGGPTI